MGCVEPVELLPSLQMVFAVITPSVLANWHPPKLGSYLPQRQKMGIEMLPSLMFKFQIDGSSCP